MFAKYGVHSDTGQRPSFAVYSSHVFVAMAEGFLHGMKSFQIESEDSVTNFSDLCLQMSC
jgi:hypothetical protein